MLDSYEVSLMENVWRVWHKKQNALKIGALLAATLIVVLGFFTFKFGAEASKYKNEAAQKVAEIKELRAKNNTILEELEAWKIRARESRERAKYTASAAKENERTFEDDQGNAELKEEEAIPLDLSAKATCFTFSSHPILPGFILILSTPDSMLKSASL